MPTIDQYYLALGAGGIVLALLIGGVLTLGRETKRERSIADTLLLNNTTLAESTKKMADAWEAQTSARTRSAR